MPSTSSTRLLARGSWPEAQRIAAVLRKETVGGTLLLVGAAIALVWANSPWAASYEALRDTRVGPSALHLDLTLGQWAADVPAPPSLDPGAAEAPEVTSANKPARGGRR